MIFINKISMVKSLTPLTLQKSVNYDFGELENNNKREEK